MHIKLKVRHTWSAIFYTIDVKCLLQIQSSMLILVIFLFNQNYDLVIRKKDIVSLLYGSIHRVCEGIAFRANTSTSALKNIMFLACEFARQEIPIICLFPYGNRKFRQYLRSSVTILPTRFMVSWLLIVMGKVKIPIADVTQHLLNHSNKRLMVYVLPISEVVWTILCKSAEMHPDMHINTI